mmetsp:Transcript_25205/g.44402  ORF Transcript_25205/g.44402 Transcript_25205/m.44402 type:complete len:208 (+) Transcript_25205:1-624(+)
MYQHCLQGGGDLWSFLMHLINAAPGDSDFAMPATFGKWIHLWKTKPHFGSYEVRLDEYKCFFPYSLQSSRMMCNLPKERQDSQNVLIAIARMRAMSAVGLVEAYHESVCLFSAKLAGSLPSHCNCQDDSEWQSFEEAKEDHGVEYTETVEDSPSDVLQDLDYITQDDRLLYNATVEHFVEEMDIIEKKFGMKVLCPHRKKMLLQQML